MTTQRSSRPRHAFLGALNLKTSLLFVFPVLLFYQLGVLVSGESLNGADLITAALLRILHHSVHWYVLTNIALLGGFVLLVLALHRRQPLSPLRILSVLAESSVYAATMGTLIVHVMGAIGIDPALYVHAATNALPAGWFERVVLACGAGVHEELVFRLMLLSGLVALLQHVGGRSHVTAVVLGLMTSALLFSAAHHVIGGEPWHVGVFVYRFFCGIFFGLLYQTRGFAVAVYTHTLYDIYVLLLR